MLKSLLKSSRDLQRLNDRLKIFWRKRGRDGAVRRYLESHQDRKLHLGCGTNVLPGWLNTDQFQGDASIVYVDVTETFPFPDGSFDFIMAEHIIEHVQRRDAVTMLRECHRVLRPNGVLRIGTPDLPKYLGIYGPSPSEIERKCLREISDNWIFPAFHKAGHYAPAAGDYNPIYLVNDIFMNYEHRFIYDYALLERMCREAGFGHCIRGVAGSSPHAPFNGVETHVDEVNTYLTVTIEATKSAAGVAPA
jgi:SAM-dependent methyltransferase